jgi:hypothetical protein
VPVCWTICGLTSGYISRSAGKEIYVLEDRCMGKGDAACHLLGRTREEWGDERAEELRFFEATRLKECLDVSLDHALYLLPSANTLRFVESGALPALLHKWTLRTCFNAQEEIDLASMDEIEQVRTRHPRLGRYIGPPCVIRNGLISPRCTEGTHFCGVPVWRDFPNAVRRL